MNTTSLSDNKNNNKVVVNQPSETPKQVIVVPGVKDVMICKGMNKKNSKGNRDLYRLIEANHDKYEASNSFGKTALLEFIVSEMIENGSRFLVREGGIWVEISDKEAQTKVANRFQKLKYRSRERITKNCQGTILSVNKKCTMNQSNEDNGISNNRVTIPTANSDDSRAIAVECDYPAPMQQSSGMVQGVNYLPQQYSLHLKAIQVLQQIIAWRFKTKQVEQQLGIATGCNDDTNEEARP